MANMTQASSMDIVQMNAYVISMAAFSIGCLGNLISFVLIIVSGLARTSTGLYIILLAIMDTLFLITNAAMNPFFSRWIHVDVFLDSSDPVMLCQVWNALEETTLYFHYLQMALIVVDKLLLVTQRVSRRDLVCCAGLFSVINLIVSAALAAYWGHQVKETLPDPYTFGKCRIAPPSSPEKYSTWFWMEVIVHLLYPDAILNLSVLALVIALSVVAYRNAQRNKTSDPDVTRAVIAYACCHLVLQVPYLIVNCLIMYLDKRWDLYDFPAEAEKNLKLTAPITGAVKIFIHAVMLPVLLSLPSVRAIFCRN